MNSTQLNTTGNPDEELAFIRKIIEDSRRSFSEDGKPYIVWGLVVAMGMTITYLSALLNQDFYVGYIWIGLMVIGYGYIAWMVRQNKGKRRTKNFVDRMQGAIWGACGSALGLGVFLCNVQISHGPDSFPPIHPYYACFVAALILGIAYFLSGFAMEIPWLRNIGVVWWVGAVAMYLFPSIHMLGLYAGMLICFQVVPGVLLNRRYRHEQLTLGQEA